VKIRRIVVGRDIAAQPVGAAAAASLAGELDADLEALFVECDELHRLSGAAFARELRPLLGLGRRIDRRPSSARCGRMRTRRGAPSPPWPRRAPFAGRSRHRVSVSRRCARRHRRGSHHRGHLALGPRGHAARAEAPVTLVVLPGGGSARGPLAVICPVTVAPEPAVSLACSLARAIGEGLTILAVGDDVEEAARWCAEAAALLARLGRKASLEIVRDWQAEALAVALERLAPRRGDRRAHRCPGP